MAHLSVPFSMEHHLWKGEIYTTGKKHCFTPQTSIGWFLRATMGLSTEDADIDDAIPVLKEFLKEFSR